MSHLSTSSYPMADIRVLLAGQTGGMPAPRRHGRDYAATAPTPADTSIFLTTLPSQRLPGWRTDINGSLIKETELKLRKLQGFYAFQDAAEILRFVRAYPSAVDILSEALPYLERLFGPAPQVILEVTFDPESEGSEELFGYIQTSLPVEEALDRLHQLDQEWFLAQISRVRGRLNFNLEFV